VVITCVGLLTVAVVVLLALLLLLLHTCSVTAFQPTTGTGTYMYYVHVLVGERMQSTTLVLST